MVNRQVRAYSILAGFFLLGAVGGGAAGRAYTQHELAKVYVGSDPQVREALFVQAIAVEIDLSPSEAQHLASVAAKYRADRRDLTQRMYETCGKPMQELQARMSEEVTAGLRPDKAARYLEVIAERRRQFGMAPR